MKNLTFALGVFVLGIASCQNNPNAQESSASLTDTIVIHDQDMSPTAIHWEGTYEGTLPCADCPGINTTIELNPDFTFVKNMKYLESNNSEFNESGTFEWHEDENTIALLPSTGSKQLYHLTDGCIKMLDQDGNEITGELADHYILNKVN